MDRKMANAIQYRQVQGDPLNRVLCFNAGHIFVAIFLIMHHTVMKFGMNIEAKHTNDM